VARFGDFEVDFGKGELRKRGVRVQVQEQPYQVLTALLERPGEVVGREELIRRLWPDGTHVDFDRGLNAAVTRLRQALLDSAEAPRYVETVARRGYRFIAPLTPVTVLAITETEPASDKPRLLEQKRPQSRFLKPVAGIVLVGTAVVVAWLTLDRDAPPPRVVALTTTPGIEMQPSFSPDGNMVAFAWDGEKQDNLDIYVKMVGSPTALRLTTDGSDDALPSWSPDGHQIAFLKRSGGKVAVYLISPLGGPEHKVLDFDAAPAQPAWSRDGDFLVIAKAYRVPEPGQDAGTIFVVPVRGGEPRRLLVPKRGEWYHYPALSPDGRELAYVSCSGTPAGPTCRVELSHLTPNLRSQGNDRRLTPEMGYFTGLTWTSDGRSVVASSGTNVGSYLWRVDASGTRGPERLEIASVGALYPAIARKGQRLAFSRSYADEDIWRMQSRSKSEPFLVSSMVDRSPDFSPDGRRIAFATSRSADRVTIWLAKADGSEAIQLTNGPENHQGSPKWSPDGRWIAFDANGKDGLWSIQLVDASGGQPRNLISGSNNLCPSWSRDGRYVYFGSDRSGHFEVWRSRANGGIPEQITRQGGMVALESDDGKTLYYTKTGGDAPLYSSRVDGTEERKVVDRIVARAFAAAAGGVYYLCYIGPSRSEIRFYESATGKDRVVGLVEGRLGLGFAVSPDRGTFLFTMQRPPANDLMLVENFR
jgi:Tol biopolymer transport system component/DNA-binding winged helix-turn-helix (wHTH) protein